MLTWECHLPSLVQLDRNHWRLQAGDDIPDNLLDAVCVGRLSLNPMYCVCFTSRKL